MRKRPRVRRLAFAQSIATTVIGSIIIVVVAFGGYGGTPKPPAPRVPAVDRHMRPAAREVGLLIGGNLRDAAGMSVLP